MDGQGLSLFQGGESIAVNNNEQERAEEEDALRDRQRRNEEIKNELENAFDDLGDDDDDDEDDISIGYDANSSANHNNADTATNAMFTRMDIKHKAHIDNIETERSNEILTLKNMLASKNQEFQNTTSQFTHERLTFQTKIDELKKRLAIADGEKERANMSRQQTHELFVKSKQKLSETEENISELNSKIKMLDDRNMKMLAELESTKSLLADTQHKYQMVERNNSYSSEKHTDSMIKQLNDRHAAQTDMMQQQINALRTKLEDRDGEIKRMTIQNNELQKSREGLLYDKADSINQLTDRLNASQTRCQELIFKSASCEGLTQENVQLKQTIADLERQNREMEKQIKDLTLRLETTSTELEQLTETAIHNVDTILGDNNLQNGIMDTPIIRKAISQPRLGVSSTPLLFEDRISRLKQEFNRCVADQKLKRQEILSLKEEIAAKNKQIDQLKVDENQGLIELTMCKENAERLEIKLKNMERELEDCKNQKISNDQEQTKKGTDDLINRLHKLEQENENFRSSCNHLNETIRALESERDSIEEKYRDACKDIAELQQKLTQQESNPCLECEKEKFITKDAQQECTRLKEMYIRINDEKEDALRKLREHEAQDLSKELLEQRNMVASLERSLQLAEMKCNEFTKILEREKLEHETQVQKIRTKYEEEISNIKSKDQKDLSNSCLKCIDLTSRVAKVDIENLQLQTACSGHLKDIHELKKALKKADQIVVDLTEKLAMKNGHDQLLDELKSKAKQFEEFMRNQSPTKSALVDVVVNGQTCRVRDQCVSTEDSLESPRAGNASNLGLDRSAEKRIREDMARAMALKVKDIENELKGQIIEFEKQIDELTTELTSLQNILRDRDTDISNLKKCILKERSEVKHILEQKETEYIEKIKNSKSLLLATQNDLDVANKQIDTLLTELDQCRRTFHGERESMNKRLNEWKVELAAFAEREEKLNDQIRQMENSHKSTVKSLNEKLNVAKKTALNYKTYSEDKEKHIERESERIRVAYETAIGKMKEKTKTTIIEAEKRANKRIADIQAQLDAIMQK